jgi:hypothetical protein
MKISSIFESMNKDDNERKFKIQAELDSIINKYETMGMSCWIYLKGDYAIEVASIKIKEVGERRQGLGTSLMTEIVELCDKYNLLCVLTPDNSETPMSVLLKFYKSFGFVSNMGRKKDFRFRNSMIRYPNK